MLYIELPFSLMAENLIWSLPDKLGQFRTFSSSFLPPGMSCKFPGTKRASDLGWGSHGLVCVTLASAEGYDTILKAYTSATPASRTSPLSHARPQHTKLPKDGSDLICF